MQDTTAFEKIENMNARINIVQGGTSAGKTWDILGILNDIATLEPNSLISVVSDTLPNLKRGAMRDFKNILRTTLREPFWKENKSDHIWTLTNGSVIEFFSTEDEGALGARRDYLFINEANRISFETFNQLEVRTKQRIYLDFNPSNEFWVHKELMKNRTDWEFLKVNYLDNESLDDNIIKSIEQRRGDGTSNWWRVYGLGEIGSLEGNIYSGWTKVEEIPEGFVLKRYGTDFGYSDPTAIVAVYENDKGEILLDEVCYKTQLKPSDIVDVMKSLEPELFVCDNARPEIIRQAKSEGIRAIPCDKSSKSPDGKINNILYGISLIQEKKVYYTGRSKNLEQEFLTYAWRKKKSTGETLDEPEDANNHALDAVRYAILDMSKPKIEYAGIRF